MSEVTWESKVVPPAPPKPPQHHTARVEGLLVEVQMTDFGVNWTVQGWLADVRVDGFAYGRQCSVEEAQAQAVAAARRMHAAGILGEPRYPVACCDATFATRDAADQHESDHRASDFEGDDEDAALEAALEDAADADLSERLTPGEEV